MHSGLEDRISNGGAVVVANGSSELPDKPSRSPDKQLPYPRPDASPDPKTAAKMSGLTNGDIDYYMERRGAQVTLLYYFSLSKEKCAVWQTEKVRHLVSQASKGFKECAHPFLKHTVLVFLVNKYYRDKQSLG